MILFHFRGEHVCIFGVQDRAIDCSLHRQSFLFGSKATLALNGCVERLQSPMRFGTCDFWLPGGVGVGKSVQLSKSCLELPCLCQQVTDHYLGWTMCSFPLHLFFPFQWKLHEHTLEQSICTLFFQSCCFRCCSQQRCVLPTDISSGLQEARFGCWKRYLASWCIVVNICPVG